MIVLIWSFKIKQIREFQFWFLRGLLYLLSFAKVQMFAYIHIMESDGLFVIGCLKSSGKYFMHIQDKNKFNNYQE